MSLYSRWYDVSLEECREQEGWETFDAFFTRRLRDGARSVDRDPRAVLSPADGRIEATGPIEAGGSWLVKGRPYDVAELVGDPGDAARLSGGAGCVVYLSPRDYHRVHAPVAGHIHRIRSIPGDFFPVNAVGLRHVANLFCRNRRVVIDIDAGAELGRVTVVMVVAMIVGRITAVGIDSPDVPFGDHVFDPPLRVAAGDEIGVFHLGSTVVLFVDARVGNRWVLGPGPVRYGQALLRTAARRDNGASVRVERGMGTGG